LGFIWILVIRDKDREDQNGCCFSIIEFVCVNSNMIFNNNDKSHHRDYSNHPEYVGLYTIHASISFIAWIGAFKGRVTIILVLI
jgi:hypothetical protein